MLSRMLIRITVGVISLRLLPVYLEADKKGRPKVKVKATEAKMARGEMVRFMAEHEVNCPEELKGFDGLGYCYHGELSGEKEYVFLKGQKDAIAVPGFS